MDVSKRNVCRWLEKIVRQLILVIFIVRWADKFERNIDFETDVVYIRANSENVRWDMEPTSQ